MKRDFDIVHQLDASEEHVRRNRLRTMQGVALGLLVIAALAFALARSQRGGHPAWAYLEAFAEAAMVGALADWFAVVALFRHPLGIPVWHTAIIPARMKSAAISAHSSRITSLRKKASSAVSVKPTSPCGPANGSSIPHMHGS